VNLATFRSRVSGAIGLDNSSGSTEQGLIDGWVNEAVEQFLVETKAHWRTSSLAVTAGSGDYILDTNILAFKDFYYVPNSGNPNRQMRAVDTEEITRLRQLVTTTGVDPYLYAIQGANILMLYPNPQSSSDTVHFLYVPRPGSTLSATGDTPSATAYGGIPAEFHPTLEAYAKWKAADYADDKSSQYGMTYMQEWANGLAKAKEHMIKKGGVRTGRAKIGFRKMWPNSPGVDTGA
jgi:hypothetical protein